MLVRQPANVFPQISTQVKRNTKTSMKSSWQFLHCLSSCCAKELICLFKTNKQVKKQSFFESPKAIVLKYFICLNSFSPRSVSLLNIFVVVKTLHVLSCSSFLCKCLELDFIVPFGEILTDQLILSIQCTSMQKNTTRKTQKTLS